MTRHVFALAIALLVAPPTPVTPAHGTTRATDQHGQTPNDRDLARRPPKSGFELTVDSIMRGPDLVGYPPTGLRWSADSQQLFFEWRKPGEREAATYVFGRTGGEPRKLSEDEARNVPPASGGRWDGAHKRVLIVDDGDVVMVDAPSGVRRQISRTTGSESNPRWARKDTAVTYVR